MNRLSNSIPFLVLLLICGSILILYSQPIVSAVYSNIGWVTLNAHLRDGISNTENLDDALGSFSQALGINAGNRSAWFGLGMTYASQHKVEQATNSWRQSEDNPVTLINYGLHARAKGDLDTALAQFRAVDALDVSGAKEGYYLAGTICQRAFGMQYVLSPSHVQFCADFLEENGDNLITNGAFSTGTLAGWGGEHFFIGKNAARLDLEQAAGSSDSIIRLDGLDENNHFGLFQRLTLSPGDTVRFSGRFKLLGEENLTARFLYIAWQKEDGTAQGNHGEQYSGDTAWMQFERTFRIPDSIKPEIDFYPVLFSGMGTVWFDDIKLELVPQ